MTENYSGDTITTLYACEYLADSCPEILGASNIASGDVFSYDFAPGVWGFIWVDTHDGCAYSDYDEYVAGVEVEVEFGQGDLSGYFDRGGCY